MVAGKNFGCGSSVNTHQALSKQKACLLSLHTPLRVSSSGNAINIGLPVMEIGEQVDRIDAGDAIGVDLSKGIVYNLTKNEQYQGTELPQFIQDIAAAGGLVNFAKTASSTYPGSECVFPLQLRSAKRAKLSPGGSTCGRLTKRSAFATSTTLSVI